MPKPEPQLPQGSSSTLRGFAESFSFHNSPEAFITSRIIDFQRQHPEAVENRAIVRAKVLNRNVAIVSSHAQIHQVLAQDASGYEASGAYAELMAPFFPSPNLLSWKILLGTFLGLDRDNSLFDTLESLQEDLLRGQFSLFPVTVNTGFWHSPRKKGKEANKKLQDRILRHMKEDVKACPFAVAGQGETEDVAKHSVLFTSSLAVKALASLLTALLSNLFLYRTKDGRSLADTLAGETEPGRLSLRLRAILLETERLSPPIVGVMRRSTRDNIISSPGEQADIRIPKGWDCWLYFVGGGRDRSTYGSTWDVFDPDRYLDKGLAPGVAYGAGPKTCLGRDAIREIVLAVAETFLRLGIQIDGKIKPHGVRGDITHGGLSLTETPAWVEAKKAIEAESGYRIVQWHRDELSEEVKNFIESNNIRYPTIVSSGGNGSLSEVMSNSELAACKGNAQNVISKLREKGMMQQKAVSPSL
ncbi:hypothetical protein J4E89_008504 [Alternaria sp. Ai002NY15]|nr:hypothetical protein J4E89_008504 [Alternaria sp. Ai002NY15]